MKRIQEEPEDRYIADAGAGVEFEYNGAKVVVVADTSPRYVHARIYSWAGVSFGAVHWYATMTVYDLRIKNLETSKDGFHKKGDIYTIFPPPDGYPEEAEQFDIEISVVAEEDIMRYSIFDGGKRHLDTKKGDRTKCLKSKKQAIEAVKDYFENFFGDGWKLEMNVDDD